MTRPNIGIDAMGGDHAPDEIVKGALDAASSNSDTDFTLIGRQELLSKWPLPSNVKIVDARDVIGCDEQPVQALRTKRDSSIMRGIKLVLEKKASAFVSAGSTGAVVAAAIFKLGLIDGVKKCGILVPIPTDQGMCALMDAGANLSMKPINYLQYAIMGTCYLKITSPDSEVNVGLLNVGEENTKGTEMLKQAYNLCKNLLTNFAGNLEGHQIMSGRFKLVLCDGYVGNVVIKLGESMADFICKRLAQIKDKSDELKSKLSELYKSFDFAEYGGAPILGINGTVLICHGRSNSKAITNAVSNAVKLVKNNINDRIAAGIKEHSLWKRFQKLLTRHGES